MKKIISSIIVLTLLASTILITPIVASADTAIPNDNKWHQFDVYADSTYTYDIVLPSTGRINIDLFFANYDGRFSYCLYDDSNQIEIVSECGYIEENTPSVCNFDEILSKGTYHLVIETEYNGGYIKVKSKFLSYRCNTKDNSTYEKPNVLSNNKIYTHAFTETNNKYAWYKFTVPSRRTVKLTFWSYFDSIGCNLYSNNLRKMYMDSEGLSGLESSPRARVKEFTLNKGVYYIKITHEWINTGRYKVRVTSFTTPKLNCKSATIKRNKTKQLKVSGGLGTIKWSSSNRRIAVVNSKGKVTGKKKGTCYIYARRNGYKMSCKIRVK